MTIEQQLIEAIVSTPADFKIRSTWTLTTAEYLSREHVLRIIDTVMAERYELAVVK